MDVKGLLERAEEAIANDGKNVFFSEGEIRELFIHFSHMGVFADTPDKKITCLKGCPLIKVDGGFKLFIKCEYCGTRIFPNSLGWCSKCGGWV